VPRAEGWLRGRLYVGIDGPGILQSGVERGPVMDAPHRRLTALLFLFLSCFWLSVRTAVARPQEARSGEKRPITVDDMIGMTSVSSAAVFSPDGKKFLLVLKRGNVSKNTNEFSLLLYLSSKVLTTSRPTVLVNMVSSSNREAISHVRWLSDSERIVFLGENPGELPQVYEVNASTHLVRALTSHATGIANFDITADGRTLLFAAEPTKKLGRHDWEEISRQGVLVEGHELSDLLARSYTTSDPDQLVFFKRRGQPSARLSIPEPYAVIGSTRLSLSPDGRFAVIGVALRAVPRGWERYQDPLVQEHLARFAKEDFTRHVFPLSAALLFDSSTGQLGPILNAPAANHYGRISAAWAGDGRSLFLHTYLPLDGSGGPEGVDRTSQEFGVEVGLPDKDFRIVPDDQWPKKNPSLPPLHVRTKQGLNDPPKIYVSDQKDEKQGLLLDPNPQFKDLAFGNVEVLSFKVRDRFEVRCGLYLPPDYDRTKRYPLVIQTHGFYVNGFSMDGSLQEWSSAFAARALAAKGIIVLQAFDFSDTHDHDHYNDDKSFGVTAGQAGRNINAAVVEGAIEYLDRQAMIARDQVGIVGFSRTVGMVEYMLTHSTVHFAAANLVDGFDFGYFQMIAFPDIAWDAYNVNGDAAPFGAGLETWIKESPSFSLDRITTPIRLVALKPAGALEQWECYAGLALQNKPVDFVLIPDADEDGSNHFVVKPWEKRIAQQGLVDWFCFWLKGEEDPDVQKEVQYNRWRRLRNLQSRERAATDPNSIVSITTPLG
jgi:dipeptidyl aminopeptidase/acylaminoacyl peptidase